LMMLGFWDDYSNVSNVDPVSQVQPLQTNPFGGPNKFWLVMLSTFTSFVLVLNLTCFLSLHDDDLPVVKPTLIVSSTVLLVTGIAIVTLILFTMLAFPASSPSHSSSNISVSSTSAVEFSMTATENPSRSLSSFVASSSTSTTFPLVNESQIKSNATKHELSTPNSLTTQLSTSNISPSLNSEKNTPVLLETSSNLTKKDQQNSIQLTQRRQLENHKLMNQIQKLSKDILSKDPNVAPSSLPISFISMVESIETKKKEDALPSVRLSPSLPSLSSNVLQSSFITTTHSVITKADWREKWPLYLTLGAGCGLILVGLMGLICDRRLFFLLLLSMPLIGALTGVSAGTSFFHQQPTLLVAIADLMALGAELFAILAFVAVYLLYKNTLDRKNNYYSLRARQYEL